MNIVKKLLCLLPAFLLFSAGAMGQTLVADFSVSGPEKCQDSSFIFDASGTSYTGTGTLSYSWKFGDNTTGTDSVQQLKNYGASGKYTITLIVTSTENLKDTVTKDVEVYPVPVVNFGNINFCARTEMTLFDSSTISTGSISTYKWTIDTLSTSTAKNPSVVFVNKGSYNIKLEIWTDKGCYGSLTKKIVIRDKPDADFYWESHCESKTSDSAVILDASPSTGPISSYKWVFPDGTTSTSKATSKLFKGAGKHLVKLITYSSTTGCHDSFSREVTVYDNPPVDFIIKNTCQDSVFYIVNKTKPDYGSDNQSLLINWDKANPTTKIERVKSFYNDTIVHTYTPNSLKTYTIEITVRSGYGCESVRSYKVEIRGKPVADFSTKNTCLDSSVAFFDKSSVSSSSGGFIKYWTWYFGDSTAGVPNISTLQNPTHKYKKPGLYKIMLVSATDAGCSDTATGTVRVYPSPKAFFVFETNCKKTPIQFKDTSIVAGGTITGWLWNFGDSASGSSNTSILKKPTHSFTAAGKYLVELVAFSNYGCSDTFRDTVFILPDPVPDFTYNGSCERSVITFVDKSKAPPGRSIISYVWDFGDGNIDNTNSSVVTHAFTTSGPQTVTLTVTTNDGCPEPKQKIINILASPKASFTNTPTCIGKSVTFTNTTTISDPGVTVSYKWSFDDPLSGVNNTSTQKNVTHTFNSKGLYNIKLVTTSSNGCKDSVIKTVEASPVPKSDFSATPICNDSAMTFTDGSSVSGSVITQRLWYWNDGSPVDASNNKKPTHKFPAPGDYDVSFVVVTVSGCRDSITKTVTTYPKPVAGFTYTPHCSDTAIQFVNTSTMGADTVYAYLWDFGDGDISYEKNPKHLYTVGGKYNVQLTAYSSKGCTNSVQSDVNVIKRPIPMYTPFGVGGNTCAANEIVFLDDNPNGGITSKHWDFGDGGTSTENEPKHTFDAPGTYQVKLTVKNAQGCDSTSITPLEIHPLPEIKFTWTGGCDGEPVTFRDMSKTESGKKRSTVRPHSNSGPLNTDVATGRLTYTYPSTGKDTFYIAEYTVFDKPEGSGGPDGCGFNVKDTIFIYAKPQPTFTSDIVCFGEPTTILGATGAEGGQISTWKWTFSDGTTVTTTTNGIPHTFNKSGIDTVTLTVTNTAGCTNTIKDVVEILEKPIAAFKANPNPASILRPEVSFTNNSKNITDFQWDFGDGFISEDLDPKHTYLSIGDYPVTLYVENASGCRDTLIDTIRVKEDYVLHVPNAVTPNGDGINDSWKPLGRGIEDYELIITNRWGEELFRTNNFNEYWNCDKNRNGVTVPEGVYLYYIRIIDYEVEDVITRKGFINVLR